MTRKQGERMSTIKGDCLDILKTIQSNSIDSMVTDPPAGISFMNKDWDDDKGGRKQWISWLTEVMLECKRVLKPGGHALVWALPRTSHWTATALEDAGFEVRDVINHIFGSGFPKSNNISKSIDKLKGCKREQYINPKWKDKYPNGPGGGGSGNIKQLNKNILRNTLLTSNPSSSEAKQYNGWGSALKPATEHWILVRKPLEEPTIAKNVLKYGTGGINIDKCRVQGLSNKELNHTPQRQQADESLNGWTGNVAKKGSVIQMHKDTGRFPANVILDDSDCVRKGFPNSKSSVFNNNSGVTNGFHDCLGRQSKKNRTDIGGYNDSGSASRFFYCAKVSKAERNLGCEELEEKKYKTNFDGTGGKIGSLEKRIKEGLTREIKEFYDKCMSKNSHPTVKPQSLMRYLITLITPPKGIVLDPFMGSGSTGVASYNLGNEFIGIEQNEEYYIIGNKRINYAVNGQSEEVGNKFKWLS